MMTNHVAEPQTSLIESFTIQPTAVIGGVGLPLATVVLKAPAPEGGLDIPIISSAPQVAKANPEIIHISEHTTTRQFVIVHHGVAVPTLLAFTALNGAFPPTVELHLWPPSLIGAYGPTQALGGTRVSVGAQLSGPAPFSVIIIGLESSDQAILPIREHGPVPADSYVYRTEARAALVGAPVDVTITATGQDWGAPSRLDLAAPHHSNPTPHSISYQTVVTIKPLVIVSIEDPDNTDTYLGGHKYRGRVWLNGPGPIGGARVDLGASPSYLEVPLYAIVPDELYSGDFEFKVVGDAPSNPIIEATYNGVTVEMKVPISGSG